MKKRYFIGLLAGLMCSPAFAAGSATGLVTGLFVLQPNLLLFKIGTSVAGAPACSTLNEWAVPIDSVIGKNLYAMLLNAQALGQTLEVSGSGICNAWPDREAPVWVRVVE